MGLKSQIVGFIIFMYLVILCTGIPVAIALAHQNKRFCTSSLTRIEYVFPFRTIGCTLESNLISPVVDWLFSPPPED